jgi:2-oxoglutarate ferredoxin oxidoreductase subunit delta
MLTYAAVAALLMATAMAAFTFRGGARCGRIRRWRCGTNRVRAGQEAYPTIIKNLFVRFGSLRAYTQPDNQLEGFMAKGSVTITVERCKGCGFCVEFCPTHVLSLSSAYNSKGYHPPNVVAGEKCSGCDLCGMYCPDFAIFGARHAR